MHKPPRLRTFAALLPMMGRLRRVSACSAALAVLATVCGAAWAGQAPAAAAGPEALASQGITPYPTRPGRAASLLQPGDITGDTLADDDIDAAFSNIEDLRWLAPIARRSKVVLVGEYHYYRTIHRLRNRILFALNTFDRYPLLALEVPFSYGGYLDHYVGLRDDAEAERFFDSSLRDLVIYAEDVDLLRAIRAWNGLHPDRRIHVGATDVEHDLIGTLRRVVVPFFAQAEPGLRIDLGNFVEGDVETLIPALIKRLPALRARGFVGPQPFLTPRYVECVLANIRSVYECHRYNFDIFRQRAIIRNLTDPRFLGQYFKSGKVMIHGGEWHTPTHFPYPGGANYLREGSYLSYDYAPTRGRTYSISIKGLAYQFGPMAEVDLTKAVFHGSQYAALIRRFQTAYRQKLVTPEAYYLMEPNGADYDRWLYRSLADGFQDRTLLIRKIDWSRMAERARALSPEAARSVPIIREEIERHDASIVVFRSPVARVRMRAGK